MARFSQDIEETFVSPTRDSSGNFDFTEVDTQNGRNYIQSNKIVPVRVITPAGTSAQQFKLTDGVETALIDADGSLNTSVTGKALTPATNTTVASNNTQTILTAGAGGAKIYSYSLASVGAGSGDIAYLSINGVVCLKHVGSGTAGSADAQTSTIDLGNNYIQITSGQTVTVTTSAVGKLAFGSIAYR